MDADAATAGILVRLGLHTRNVFFTDNQPSIGVYQCAADGRFV